VCLSVFECKFSIVLYCIVSELFLQNALFMHALA